MFAEMLSRSEEIIFLEAIDQNFELDPEFDDKNLKNDEINQSLESMSVKFCDNLEKGDNTFDMSTENESYDSILRNNTKKNISLNDYLIIDKGKIEDTRHKIFKYYKSQIDLEDKIKAIFH